MREISLSTDRIEVHLCHIHDVMKVVEVPELTVVEEIRESEDEADEGGGHGKEGEHLHSWLITHNPKPQHLTLKKLQITSTPQ